MPDDPGRPAAAGDLDALFHRLNNQLGVILAHAELLEAKATDDANRARAAHVVGAALEALVRDPRHYAAHQPVTPPFTIALPSDFDAPQRGVSLTGSRVRLLGSARPHVLDAADPTSPRPSFPKL